MVGVASRETEGRLGLMLKGTRLTQTYDIAARAGVSPSTVRRMARRARPHDCGRWLTKAHVNADNFVCAFGMARADGYNKRLSRRAVELAKAGQLQLFN